jgi:AP endonuclease family 2 C terminus.
MEWECCIKSPEQGAREGVTFIENLIINCTDKKFDDFAGGEKNEDDLKNILNI